MPLPKHLLEEQVRRHDGEHRAAEGDRRRDAILTALACMAWAGLGIFLLMLSVRTDASALARVSYFGGVAIGNGGIIFTLLAAYRRGEKRGDW